MTIQEEQVFSRNKIARGHHLFAQANSLAVAVINDELALTSKTELAFKRQVKLHEQVVAKAEVIQVHADDKTTVEVKSYVKKEPVFAGVFHMYRTSGKKETSEMKIAMDAMGADNAPQVVVECAMEAITHLPDLEVILVGDQTTIVPYLT